MKQHTKWFAAVLAVAGGLAVVNSARADIVLSDFSNFNFSVTYANWADPGWETIDGGAGITAPTLTSGATPGSFSVNAGGYGSGHYDIPVGNQQLLPTYMHDVTLSLTLNSPAVMDSWLGVKFLLSDNQGNSDVFYGTYTGLWGTDAGAWANGNVGTGVWTGNTLTMTVPLTPAMLAAVQTGNDQITGFNVLIDPAYFANGAGPIYDVTYNSLTVVPEPTTMALLGIGVAGVVIARRRSKAS